MAGASAPAVIVLDYRLPDMLASELLEKFKADARWARARVLLISGLPRAYISRDLPIDAFVQKPFDLETLLEVARAVMQREPARGE